MFLRPLTLPRAALALRTHFSLSHTSSLRSFSTFPALLTNSNPSPSELEKKIHAKKLRNHQISKDPTDYHLPHPLWDDLEVNNVAQEHYAPSSLRDRLALWTIKTMRFNFDVMTGFKFGQLTTSKWLNRLIFLETVAGVPGSAAAVIRHLHSLRMMRHDHGWIHTLMEEAENERMHLMTFLELKNPSLTFRLFVFMAQGVFWNFYFISYLLSPAFCHKMVGYLEEEAVATYSKLISHLEEGRYPEWKCKPPAIAVKYWHLNPSSTMLDLFKMIRADEAHHRDVNHFFSSLHPEKDNNPIEPGH